MAFGRAAPLSSGTDQLAAIIEIAKDPEKFSAKLKELQGATDAAAAAIAEATERRAALSEREQALNYREADLVRRSKAADDAATALASDRGNFSIELRRHNSERSAFFAELRTRSAELDAREAAAVQNANRIKALSDQTMADQTAASALTAKLKDIVDSADDLKRRLLAL